MENPPSWESLEKHFQDIKETHLNEFFEKEETRGAHFSIMQWKI